MQKMHDMSRARLKKTASNMSTQSYIYEENSQRASSLDSIQIDSDYDVWSQGVQVPPNIVRVNSRKPKNRQRNNNTQDSEYD